MASSLDRELQAAAAERARRGLTRATVLDGAGAGIDFGSNDYLGLARDPELVEAAAAAARAFGAGGRAARLLRGGSPLHEQAERAVADWLGAAAALLFPSGYQANVGLLSALARRGDAIVSDRDNHASLIDGARLSRARVIVHGHLDLGDLERALRAAAGARRRLVVTEGVFSMRGDAAPLREIDALCRRHDAWLIVDEAHAIGVLGPEGAGAWAAADAGPGHRLCARVVTAGKALGAAGALVVGSDALRTELIHAARSFLFTTAPQPALAGTLVAAVARCRAADAERERLFANRRRFCERLGLPTPAAAIVPVPVGRADAAVALAEALRDEGFYAPAVRPPTVADGEAQVRVVCHADHTQEQIDAVADAIVRHRAPVAPAVTATPGGAEVTFVVGTDTGVGKTVVSGLLLRAALRLGPARYWKPVQTGDDDDTATVRSLAGAGASALLPNLASYPLPASPHEAAAAAGARIERGAIDDAFAAHRQGHGRLLVEFAGGLMVPYDLSPPVLQVDWLAAQRGRVVLVARSGLGTLNHTLLSVEALHRRGVAVAALFLVGPPHASNRATLAALAEVERIFELPQLDALDARALDAWLDLNDLTELFA